MVCIHGLARKLNFTLFVLAMLLLTPAEARLGGGTRKASGPKLSDLVLNFDALKANISTSAAYTAGTGCGSNTTWYDQKGLYNATLANFDTCTTTGWLNSPNRISKDSTNDTITVSDHNNLSFTDGSGNDRPFTLEMWVNVTNAASNRTLISKMGAANAGEFVVWLSGTEIINVDLITTNWSSNRISFTSTSSLSTGAWNHVIVTYDGSESPNGLRVYNNGILMAGATSTTGTYTGMGNTTGNVHIGSWDGTQFYLAGAYGIVRIYKVALTPTEASHNCKIQAYRFSVTCSAPVPVHIITANSYVMNATYMRVNKPTQLAVNDLMVVYVSLQNTGVYTPPSGWVERCTANLAAYGNRVFTKVATSADVAASYYEFTFSTSSTAPSESYSNITIYRNINLTEPITVANSNSGTGTTITYLGGTALSNSLIYAIGGGFGVPGLITGFTQREYNAGWKTITMDKQQSTAGATGNFTGTHSTSTGWFGYVILIKGP